MQATSILILLFIGSWIHAQQFTWTELPDNTYPDSLHWPFILGVASSEPDTDAIYIWTYAEPDSFTQANRIINWEFSADNNFNALIDLGSVTIDNNTSWTTMTLYR